ncbi:MAG TPA: acyl-CoA reductase [Thermoanaerobaculia bacterium]|nr:acyl-CoA reductase [Thermoanaerobaculia bacterium]
MSAPEQLAALMDRLGTTGAAGLAALDDETLLAGWGETVEAFLDPRSPDRVALEPALVESTGLSPQGLAAGLEAVLGGVRTRHAEALLRRAHELRSHEPDAVDGPRPARQRERSRVPAVAVLAGNLPALAVQPLLPALAMRRPLLLKSASAEPHFAPACVTALARRLPALANAVAAVTWPGGDAAIEEPVLAAAHCVLAYGDRASVADLERRAPGKVIDYGPKLSFAVVAADAELASAARGVARDVALFDQRGCLSVQAAFVEGDAVRACAFGVALARALGEIAAVLPPGPIDAGLAAAVQQLRGEAELRGALAGTLPLASGTILLEPTAAALTPSPGLRTVRVYPLATLAELALRLASWEPLLQGAALAGKAAWELAPTLGALGISRCAAPGELQSPDASWHNGGRDPLAVLA